MGNTMRIDSLKFARKLEAAGLDRKAAEAIAEGVNEVDVSDLATKADIATVREEMSANKTELKGDIASLRTELKGDIAGVRQAVVELRAEFYRHMWLQAAAVVGLTVTLIKVLP
jgi:hypothetical protein